MASLPETVGRYHVVGLLATGGMAEILLGRVQGPSGFERPVVIKRVLPHLARAQSFVNMFLDEARILSSIRHPNVVQVQELGRDAEELYLVMEFLEGESLGTVVRRLRVRDRLLPHALTAHIVAEACAGLHAAHELTDPQGAPLELVHRDVTPQNIFITYTGQVKVIDFGIAQAARRLAHTEPGHVKGKFAYMSPEQCLGEPLDRRSDIFSLGIILFELGTGRRLFKRASDLLTFKAICQDRYPRPRVVEPTFPLPLEHVVIGSLRRSRDKRYPTAAAMQRQLRLVQRELPLDELPTDALAALMRELFAERIEHTEHIVRRLQAGSAVTALPAAEVDRDLALPSVEDLPDRDETQWIGDAESEAARGEAHEPSSPPAVGAAAPTRAGASSGRGAAPRSGFAWRVVLLTVLLLGAVAAGWWLGPGKPTAESPPESDPVPGPSEPTAAPSLPASNVASGADRGDAGGSLDAAVALIRLTVETVPSGALVKLAGTSRGSTPASLEIAQGTESIELVLSLNGYVPIVEQIVPDTDAKLRYVLRPAPRSGHGSGSPAATASSGRGFRRFD